MIFRLYLLSLKKVYTLLAIGIPLIIIIGLLPAIYFMNNIAYFIPVFLILLAAVVISMHIFSREAYDITINENGMTFNGRSISQLEILGYYLNTDAIGMTLFDIRLKNGKKVRLCCSNFGTNKTIFDELVSTATRMIDASTESSSPMNYSDMYPTEVKILKPMYALLIGFVVIMNLYSIYLYIENDTAIFPRLILMNGMAIGFYAYLRRK